MVRVRVRVRVGAAAACDEGGGEAAAQRGAAENDPRGGRQQVPPYEVRLQSIRIKKVSLKVSAKVSFEVLWRR